VDNNDTSSNGVRPTISQEAVSEFQINRSGYDAEFGRAAGGVINIISKSGTNQFHGNVYNYFRNERLDARNAFAASHSQDPSFNRNQPGFTFGGPMTTSTSNRGRKTRPMFAMIVDSLLSTCVTGCLSRRSSKALTAAGAAVLCTSGRSPIYILRHASRRAAASPSTSGRELTSTSTAITMTARSR
jgi:hypothetical protein